MSEKWIKDSGNVSEQGLHELVSRYFDREYYYLAGCTNEYCSGQDNLNDFINDKASALLELRVFSRDRELLLSRSIIGHDFNWRITDDGALEQSDYIDYEHYIDINTDKSVESDHGMYILSTVGGRYKLPVTKSENAVLIRAYISYDNNGMAKVTDHRVCGFSRKEV